MRYVHSVVDFIPVVDSFRRHRLYKSHEKSLVVAFYFVLAFLLVLDTDTANIYSKDTRRTRIKSVELR